MWLIATLLTFVLLVIPLDSSALRVQDSLRVAGQTVRLDVDLDSIAVVTTAAVTISVVQALVARVLAGATPARSIGDKAWLFSVPGQTREGLTRAARQLQARTDVRWAGLTARTPGASEPAVVIDEFAVRFLPGITPAQIDQMNLANDVEIVKPSGLVPNHYILRDALPGLPDAIGMANRYHNDPRTMYAHPNLLVPIQASALPLEDPMVDEQWHLAKIHAPDAWVIEAGDAAITIAIVERGGFDTSHPDLADKLWENPWEAGTLSGPELFNKPKDYYGWNFGGDPTCPSPGNIPAHEDACGSNDVGVPSTGGIDSDGPFSRLEHGTRVAGMAAADGGNGKGGSGVCQGCSLMLVRLYGLVPTDVRAAAIDYAAKMGADIINLSWSDRYPDDTFRDVIEDAVANGRDGKGITIVASPPNRLTANDALDFCDFMPDGVPLPLMAADTNVISVTKTDSDDIRGGFTGGGCLTLVAPGVDVLSTDHLATSGPATGDPGDYAVVTGNSFAAPIVSGVVGLMLSRNPNLTRNEIKEILINTAEKVGGVSYDPDGHDVAYGYGRVNALAAVEAVPEPPPDGYEWWGCLLLLLLALGILWWACWRWRVWRASVR